MEILEALVNMWEAESLSENLVSIQALHTQPTVFG